MNKFRMLAVAVVISAASSAHAGNADAGKAKAAICGGCHGMNGISAIPTYPNLKGQKEQYLVKSLRAYRDGQRNDPLMSPMAKPLTDADIDNLAAYFSGL
jgi:cytochrome c553